MRIIQVCAGAGYGDGVGNDMFQKAKLFRELGYTCEIFVKYVDDRVRQYVHLIEELSTEPDDILLYHFCGYSEILDLVHSQNCVKVLIYHNITPPDLFDVKDSKIRTECEMGLRQLEQLRGQYDYYVGVSAYNVEDMKRYGIAGPFDVLPIAIERPPLIQEERRHKQRHSTGTRFLYVGRIVRNKMQHVLLRCFDYYWSTYDQNASLTLVGDTYNESPYYQELCALIATLPSKQNIRLTGKVSDDELYQAYEEADVYLSFSRHEGFGIPLLEAMWYQIPVFAFRSAAVGETLGDAGILLETDEPEQVAEILYEVIKDDARREAVIRRQNERVRAFLPEEVKRKLGELVDKWRTDPLKTMEERTVYRQLFAAQAAQVPAVQVAQNTSAGVVPHLAEHAGGQDADIERMRSLAENYAFRPLYSCRKYIGGLIVFGKRVVRKLLKWYLEPVCFQQTDFNLAAVNTVSHIRDEQMQIVQFQGEQARLARQLQEEQAQLAQQLQEEQVRLEGLRKEQEQLVQQFREEQARFERQLREEQAQLTQRCTSVIQEDVYLAEQVQRMRNYLDRLDASGIPIFQPEQGIRWWDNKMSQDGTDTIVSTIAALMGIPSDQVYYLDLGANHAVEFSSTYFFYKNGARGVLVEANPALIPELQVLRSGDTVVDRAVAAKSGERIPFYVVSAGDELSSTSKTWVQDCIAQSDTLGQAEEIQVDTITINEIMEHYCEQTPVFVDLDIEGMELEILRTLDFQKYRPLVFAVETIPFHHRQFVLNEKNEEIVALMEENGYVEYAFTGINSIFVDRRRLEAGK